MRGTTIAILVLALIGGTGHLWRSGNLPELAFLPVAWTTGGSAPAGADAGGSNGAGANAGAGKAAGDAADLRGNEGVGSSEAHAAKSEAPSPAAQPGRSLYYQWVDEQGSVHFARSLDEVPADWRGRAGQIEVDAPVAKRAPKLASAEAAGAKRARAGRRAAKPHRVQRVAAVESPFSRNHDVTVYTAPWCGWCRKTIAFLDERGVVYENKDIESDVAYADELREKTGETSIPFVEIDGAEIHGFNPVEMTRLLIE